MPRHRDKDRYCPQRPVCARVKPALRTDPERLRNFHECGATIYRGLRAGEATFHQTRDGTRELERCPKCNEDLTAENVVFDLPFTIDGPIPDDYA